MKNLSKIVVTSLLVVGLGLSFSGISFADKDNDAAFIKLMNESSAALQAKRPHLASELKKWSDEEANEKEEKGEKKELEGKAEREMHKRREDHLKLLRDSAAALKRSNPGLAAELTKTADDKEMRMADKKKRK